MTIIIHVVPCPWKGSIKVHPSARYSIHVRVHPGAGAVIRVHPGKIKLNLRCEVQY